MSGCALRLRGRLLAASRTGVAARARRFRFALRSLLVTGAPVVRDVETAAFEEQARSSADQFFHTPTANRALVHRRVRNHLENFESVSTLRATVLVSWHQFHLLRSESVPLPAGISGSSAFTSGSVRCSNVTRVAGLPQTGKRVRVLLRPRNAVYRPRPQRSPSGLRQTAGASSKPASRYMRHTVFTCVSTASNASAGITALNRPPSITMNRRASLESGM